MEIQASSTTGGIWGQQPEIELAGTESFVAYGLQGSLRSK